MARQLPLPLMPQQSAHHVVNVASVPKRSPFRYPGGKTWLVPRIRDWLGTHPTRPVNFIEPFTGGGIIGLTVAFESLADHVTLAELDPAIAAVWHTVLDVTDGTWLAETVADFDLTIANIERLYETINPTTRERALQTIIRNRTNHGGILAPGSGMIKHGESGRGIRSRWYPDTLRKRILDIVKIRDRFSFIEGDGIDVMRQHALLSDCTFFIDPPYTAPGKSAGRRLYTTLDAGP